MHESLVVKLNPSSHILSDDLFTSKKVPSREHISDLEKI